MISLVSAPRRLTRVAAAVFGAGSSCHKNELPDQPVNGARVRQRTEPGNLETIRFASTSVVKAASSSATAQAARRLSVEDFPVRRSAKRSKETFGPSLSEFMPARSTADMNKHVFASAIRLNEAESLLNVEPLYSPGAH